MTPPLPFDGARAFPRVHAAAARRVAGWLAQGESHAPIGAFAVSVGVETLQLPERVYYQPARLTTATHAGGLDGLLALCLGSRHHDGFVREACLRRLLEAPEPWVIPFVVRLAGEYVVEIVQAIEDALPALDPLSYGRFFLDNPRFLDTTGRRVTSYYYAYHAAGYLRRGDEPGSRVLAAFRRMRDAAGAAPG